MSWEPNLLVKCFFLPFLGFFEMLLFFLLDPWEEDLSDPSEDASKAEAKYKPEVAVAAADADVPCPGTLALWKVLSVLKRYCLLPGERIMAWSGQGQEEDPCWSPGRGWSGPGFRTLSCHDENRDH